MIPNISALTKLYYTIGEVAEMFDVSKSLIRYWESEFSILKPGKNRKGDRRFTKQNIEQLAIIYHLVKEKGYTLDGAKNEIKSNRSAQKARIQLLDKLTQIRDGLTNLKEEM
jgi:DNA-binding transcriptional MerR regulator